MITTNYHTHTMRCRHAEGTDEDYVLKALEAGLNELGFSDHSPWPYHPLDSRNIRMDISLMQDYVHHINALRRQYASRIKIYLGVEAEYYEGRMDQLKNLIETHQLDYVVLGNHFHLFETNGRYYGHYNDTENLLRDYEADTMKALESGLFDYFAHPDIFVRSMDKWTPEATEMSIRILKKAKELNIPVEYNLGGIRNQFDRMTYPYPKFWEIAAKIQGPVMIGVDAHSPLDLIDYETIEKAEQYLKKLGINPLKELKMPRVHK
jgi:histidinol-phosphatase (PHP family)